MNVTKVIVLSTVLGLVFPCFAEDLPANFRMRDRRAPDPTVIEYSLPILRVSLQAVADGSEARLKRYTFAVTYRRRDSSTQQTLWMENQFPGTAFRSFSRLFHLVGSEPSRMVEARLGRDLETTSTFAVEWEDICAQRGQLARPVRLSFYPKTAAFEAGGTTNVAVGTYLLSCVDGQARVTFDRSTLVEEFQLKTTRAE